MKQNRRKKKKTNVLKSREKKALSIHSNQQLTINDIEPDRPDHID